MTTPQSYLARKAAKKAAKATLKHTIHGTTSKAKRQPIRSVTLLALGAAVGALVATLLARRGRVAADDEGAIQQAAQEQAAARHEQRRADLDDRTLTDRVKSEIFRPVDAPKGDVVVDAEGGIVHLRGSVVSAAQRDQLVTAARAVDGVLRVEDLLHVRS
ncbi:BON domain-containing protein [Patulibacter sp. S7RM1-6]